MVEVYMDRQRRAELESQLSVDWNLKLPNDISLCEDILQQLERAISKLEESNAYLRTSLESIEDTELSHYIEENELVIRRKLHQVQQVTSHIDTLKATTK